MTNVNIKEAKFSKASKKLVNYLKTQHDLNLKLSEVQELLAQSLGFRNLHELQNLTNTIISKEKNNQEENKRSEIFQNLDSEQSIQIITSLMNPGDNSMWKSRAISLISAVMIALTYLRDKKEIVLNIDIINEYLIFENLLKLYKDRKDLPLEISKVLRSYLISLPGFQEAAPKQNNTVIEQHGYLQMQFSSVFSTLKKIENNNFIIADKTWFSIQEKEVEIVFKPKLQELDILEDSWLKTKEYQELITSKRNRNTTMRVSDLLIYAVSIISSEKRHRMQLLLNSILDNYSVAASISADIRKALK